MVKKKVKSKAKKKGKVVKEKIDNIHNKFLAGVGIFIGVLLLLGFLPVISNGGVTGHATAGGVLQDANTGIEITKGAASSLYNDYLTHLFEFLLGEGNGGGEFFFSKVLFFILIFGLGFSALSGVDFFQEHKNFLYVFVFGVSVLAVRTIGTADFMDVILLPYTALGITISAAAPLVFWFIVVNKGFSNYPALFRKIAWILFVVVFLGLYIYRRQELLHLSYIYAATAIIALMMVLFDGTIRKYAVIKVQTDAAKVNMNRTIIDDLTSQIGEYGTKLASGAVDLRAYNKAVDSIRKKINALS